MNVGSITANEAERINSLNQLQIMDTVAEEDFDDIVALAAQTCNAPVATIAFEGEDRVWFKAMHGLNCNEITRDSAFCSTTVKSNDLLIISDPREDEQFFGNPLLKEALGIRFFAGMPLISDDGFILGYLCVMDYQPRTLSSAQHDALRILGKQVMNLLKLRAQIIKLKKAEEDSRKSEEQINTIFYNAIDAVIVMDDNGVITQWNPRAESIFGWKSAEAIGTPFHEKVFPEYYREIHLARMQQYKDAETAQLLNSTVEAPGIRKNKTELPIALGISPAVIGGHRFFICFVSDNTDRKLSTFKLDKQKEFYENILNSLPTDIAVFDPAHKYLFVNPGAIKDEEFRKYIIGKDDFEYCEYRKRDTSIAQLRREQFLQVKNSGKEIRWEDTVRDTNGNPYTHLRRLFPVYDDNGNLTMVIGFGMDITDRKVMEEKQTALVQQLSSQNTQLIDFCNIVSHNLRAPLVNMSMLVKFIEESDDEEEQKLLISKFNPVIENLNTTFNELVESIQIKQDLEVTSENIELADCLKRTLEVLKVEINRSGAIIEANFDEAKVIHWPPKYLFSVFHNLVSNALKYQSPERLPLIQLQTVRKGNKVTLTVKDNGLGIDLVKHKDNLFKIGKVFHRHPDAKGFGLFMTKTQVDAMNSRIWAESTPNVGTTFFIEFNNQDT